VSVDETLDEPRSAELDVLRARREQALAQANAERRWALPLNLGLGTKRVEEAGLDDDMMIVELTIPLPLFDRNQAARVRSAAEAERAEAQYQRALQKTRSRRAAALMEARQLSASARTLLDEAVPEAAQLTQIARASFAEGELGLVELLDAHAAEIELIQQAWALQSRALDALLELQLLSPPDHPVH
jgi:cobalt-zinc-cadmium efflux system outer membrane protein